MIDIPCVRQAGRHLLADQHPVPRPRDAHILKDAEPAALVSEACYRSRVLELFFVPPFWRPADLTLEAALLPAGRPDISLDVDAPAGNHLYYRAPRELAKGANLTHHNFASNASICFLLADLGAYRFAARPALFPFPRAGKLSALAAPPPVAGCGCCPVANIRRQHPRSSISPHALFSVSHQFMAGCSIFRMTRRGRSAASSLFVSGSAAAAPQVLEEFSRTLRPHHPERYGNE